MNNLPVMRINKQNNSLIKWLNFKDNWTGLGKSIFVNINAYKMPLCAVWPQEVQWDN